MLQLSFFSRSEIAAMRDRTKARNYSRQGEAFRREHQRRRNHGKAQRHAARIYHAFQQSCGDEVPRIPPSPPLSSSRRASAPPGG
jgi:hypothetical protein